MIPQQQPARPPRAPGLSETVATLSPFERALGLVLTVTFVFSGLVLLARFNTLALEEVPRTGGTYTEGIVGFPRFINPILAVSGADRDLTQLIYAGLMHVGPTGNLEPELAESWSVSEDRSTYTFTLRSNLRFHDGTPVTAEDVRFTILRTQDTTVKSPRFSAWEGVTVEAPDERTVVFTLAEPYSAFLENTTLGILPRHIWEHVQPDEMGFSEWNVQPVGAGPYRVAKVLRDVGGIPSSYLLESFDHYVLGTPHIRTVTLRLYRSIEDAQVALATDKVDALGGVPPADVAAFLRPQTTVVPMPQLRLFSAYLNHNRISVFLRPEVRHALELALPRDVIVETVLAGYGWARTDPLPYGVAIPGTQTESEPAVHARIAQARELLEAEGWEMGEDGIYTLTKGEEVLRLTFSLAGPNTPELEAIGALVTQAWRDLGAEVEFRPFEPTDLTQNIIRPRRFDALLFGTVIGRELDLYPFWHSSQRSDPGLNVAQYASISGDSLLEKARAEVDADVRKALYGEFVTLVTTERPALFLYSPAYLYLMPERVKNMSTIPLVDPSERFSNIHTWYIETDRVWPFVQTLRSY